MRAPRFLLDEHVWADLIGLGPQLGTDLILVQRIAQKGIPDAEVLALAAQEGRVLLTANTRDFAPLAAEWFLGKREHWGIIIVPGQTKHSLLIAGITNIVKNETAESLKNTFRYIQEFVTSSS